MVASVSPRPRRGRRITGKGAAVLTVALSLCPWSSTTPPVARADNDGDVGLPLPSLSTVEVLLRLYDTTRGMEWKERTGWLDPAYPSPCTWAGIECWDVLDGDPERGGHVKSLDLSDNKLRGIIPEDLYHLPYLESLTLRDNPDLIINMVGIERAVELKELVLSNTGITDLRGVGRVKALEYLHVTDCDLDEPVPEEIFTIESLRGLYANYAGFEGTLPTTVGNLRLLEELYLYENDLSGPLPTELGRLTNLEVLALAQNSFSGTIPEELDNLSKLRILAIQREYGKEKGVGISGTLPTFRGLRSLSEMYLENQLLEGEIKPFFLSGAPKGEIVKVDLMNNYIEGEVPSSMVEFDRLTLFLSGNKITDLPDTFCTKMSWMDGMVGKVADGGSSGCDAILCPLKTYNDYGRALPEEPCRSCSDTLPYMGAWECKNPDAPRTQIDVLYLFYATLNGDNWDNNRDWVTETNECDWHGIECNENNRVTGIDLQDNGLKGTPPKEIFQLPMLSKLNLMSNAIDFKFDGINWAQNLLYLYISNTGLSNTDDMDQMLGLPIRELHISQNNLVGRIPSTIFNLQSLKYLSISHNRFTGTLSPDIGLLTNLVEFIAYGNSLTGQIPSEVGDMGPQLEMLILSENDFEGTLPIELNKLTGLTTLSLHQTTKTGDGVGGTLPSLANLSQLIMLHLGSNSLAGNLPPDLLANSNVLNDEIEIDLSDNSFSGTVPSAWTRFRNLDLDLSDNAVEGLGSGICDMSAWNEGDVGVYGCDGILCPRGYYSEAGRKASGRSGCTYCSSSKPASGSIASVNFFMGMTQCEGTDPPGTVTAPSGASVDQRGILEKFYYSTSGDDWDYNDGWTVGDDVCEGWFGISCNDEGEVIKIELAENGLTGTPVSELFDLPRLRELDLQGNDMGFDFTSIDNAAELHTIYLSDTGISSIEGIGEARALKTFHCTSNSIEDLPDEIFSVTTLERLFLNYNRIEGRLSSLIGNLINLQELYLMHNHMVGQIPAAIGELTNLRVLALTENNFGGTLPEELNRLTRLEVLAIQREGGVDYDGSAGGDDVGSNKGESDKAGDGISGPLLTFDGLTNIKELYLGSNSLTGTIPYNFLFGVNNFDRQITVDIVSNQISGTVPSTLLQFDSLTLYAAGNKITAVAPGLCNKENWMEGDMGTYGCDGLLCPPGSKSIYGRQSGSGADCEDCGKGTKAPYYGSFECITDGDYEGLGEADVLREFYDALGGPGWTLDTGWKGDDDFCTWQGVRCVSETVRTVQALRLPQNGLKGTVPANIFSLPHIQEINLGGNSGVTFTFDDIDQATKLTYLNLDDLGLKDLNGLRNAQTLKLLHVMGNDFDGMFPEDLLFLSNLEVLYISDNDIGPTLTSSLKTLKNLVYLQCYDCGLTGPVPTWFSELPEMEYLRLDQNSFTGMIPTELALVPKLEHLDLSDQISRGGEGLTGQLPSFTGLERLTEIYLNKNAITGTVPANFLGNVGTDLEVKVDLRKNQISGAIPSELGRFPGFSIYASDNLIDQPIPQDVCTLAFTNGYGCEGVLCPPQTFSPLGRKTDGGSGCIACGTGQATFYGTTDCDTTEQRDILEKLYYDTNGGEWEVNDGWTVEESICDWFGITCSTDLTYVTGITLQDNGLSGEVPTDIYNLPMLETIMLKKNDITVSMSGIGKASNLRMLSLSETGISSVQGISAAKGTLRYLHLTNNNLDAIPEEIYDLTKLEDLYMNYNEITTPISTRIGDLTNLKNFFLFHNQIPGTLPTEIGRLADLRVMALGENYLTGIIPTELARMKNIEIIALQREGGESAPGIGGPLAPKTTSEVGGGLTGLLPPFKGLPKLRELYLGYNSLSGEIPNEFLSGADKAAEIKIDLTMNELVGEVPDFLKEFEQMKLYAAGNRLMFMSPALCSKTKWMSGEVVTSGCDAILCKPGTFNTYGRAAAVEIPCEECPFTFKAEYYGSIQCLPTNKGSYSEREVLRMFYVATGGDNWVKKTNWMNDDAGICTWHGVSCDKEGETVTRINLASNNLGGTVPPVIFQMQKMYELNLKDNPVDFEFEGIEQALALTELYLDSSKLTSLDGVGEAKGLRILHLEQNNFKGDSIPAEIFNLKNLKHLYLSDSLFGGTLPSGIKDLTDLEEFYCHGNEITGTIPTEIAELSNLEVLVLSENNIIGTIPSEISRMTSLRSLFIDSFTKRSVGLSGPMPDFSGAVNLKEIYLNANGLTGTVPADLLSGLEDKDATVTLGLQSNQLTGTVPPELRRFTSLNIDLAGNQITGIDDLCDNGDWMSGLVGKFGCDAILCPPGTFNQHGRQSNDDSGCVPCNVDDDDISIFFGALTCQSEERKTEKEILKILFQQCGGANCKNKDNWVSPDVDVCKWYGISCHESKLVDSILLGSNNLVGTPPKELFEMSELKWLWLYANPIKFKFDGIGNAPKLTSLLLDSTGLDSLAGVEDASVLEDLDVRFNNLKGGLDQGLSKLVNLKTFSCADNQLLGSLPSFRSLKNLERLRMGGNKFNGVIPDYSTNRKLKSLDLSDNALQGPIPPTLLKGVDHSESVYVDLSSNQLTGIVPSELDVFEKLTIYLRDNRLKGIDPSLCENDQWNDGDVGSFDCDGIMCPEGTYAPNDGRASRAGSQCISCSSSQFFGMSTCGGTASSGNTVTVGWVPHIVASTLGALFCLMGI